MECFPNWLTLLDRLPERHEPVFGSSLRDIVLSLMIAMVMLFSTGVAFDPSQAAPPPAPATHELVQEISAAIPGPAYQSCTHIRWCYKPAPRRQIGKYPIVEVRSPLV